MTLSRASLSLVALSLLAACGGGGDAEPVPTPTPEPKPTFVPGMWAGSSSAGFDLQTLVTVDGELWALYQHPFTMAAGFLHSNEAPAVDGEMIAEIRDYRPDGDVAPGKLEATVEAEKTLVGRINGTGMPASFDTVFDPRYYQAASFGALEGSWELIENGVTNSYVAISRFGALSGYTPVGDQRCDYQGNVVPNAEFYYYRVSITFSNSWACAMPGHTVEGIVLHSGNGADARLAIALLSTDKWTGLAAIGVRPRPAPEPEPQPAG